MHIKRTAEKGQQLGKAALAQFRQAGKLRESGKSIAQISRSLGITKEQAARALWRYDETTSQMEHGKPSTYTYYGCRCVECTVATTNAAAEHRAELRAHPERVKHGTYTGYYSAGCRCRKCRAYGDPRVEDLTRPLVPDAPRARQPWTDEELAVIHDYSRTAKEIAAEIGRTPSAVKAARRVMWRKVFATK